MGRGRSVYKQPGTRVDEDRTTQKGGISKRDSVTKGVIKELLRELCHVLLYNVKPVYIMLLCVCRSNKRIVFRL
jgi:hypothetical protein